LARLCVCVCSRSRVVRFIPRGVQKTFFQADECEHRETGDANFQDL